MYFLIFMVNSIENLNFGWYARWAHEDTESIPSTVYLFDASWNRYKHLSRQHKRVPQTKPVSMPFQMKHALECPSWLVSSHPTSRPSRTFDRFECQCSPANLSYRHLLDDEKPEIVTSRRLVAAIL